MVLENEGKRLNRIESNRAVPSSDDDDAAGSGHRDALLLQPGRRCGVMPGQRMGRGGGERTQDGGRWMASRCGVEVPWGGGRGHGGDDGVDWRSDLGCGGSERGACRDASVDRTIRRAEGWRSGSGVEGVRRCNRSGWRWRDGLLSLLLQV